MPQSAVHVGSNNFLVQPAGISVSQGNWETLRGHPVKLHSKVSNLGVAGFQFLKQDHHSILAHDFPAV